MITRRLHLFARAFRAVPRRIRMAHAAVFFCLTALVLGVVPASATYLPAPIVSTTPDSRNIYRSAVYVGGQYAYIEYTQHIKPGQPLIVRTWSPSNYTSNNTISHQLSGFDVAIDSVSVSSKTPASALPTEEYGSDRKSYRRFKTSGCSAVAPCVVDEIFRISFDGGLAEGYYTFTFTALQGGEFGSISPLIFHVNNNAPSGNSESERWASIGLSYPCNDLIGGIGADNDFDYSANCKDSDCEGEDANVDGKKCEYQTEISCGDSFDNDSDGLTDCKDTDCWGRVAKQVLGVDVYCRQYEASLADCNDGFDNDGDGFEDCRDNAGGSNSCWAKPAFGCPNVETSCTNGIDDDYDLDYPAVNGYDSSPTGGLTGADCADIDCKSPEHGNYCPQSEDKDAAGNDNVAQCFDGADNDLDGDIDCADSDCLGLADPGDTGLICYEYEFSISEHYQMCNNGFNDDFLAGKDCEDPACAGKFEWCGPCPAHENFTYDSCATCPSRDLNVQDYLKCDEGATSLDDDGDGDANCADGDCGGLIGNLDIAARCAEEESDMFLCSDGWDNDADTLKDCREAACGGLRGGWVGGAERFCESGAEISCGDSFDNDGDGLADCMDHDCVGIGSCAPENEAVSQCASIPLWGSTLPKPIAADSNPTVFARSHSKIRSNASSNDTAMVILFGTGNYDAVDITIGDATDEENYYLPADTDCTLTGTNSSQFMFSVERDAAAGIGKAVHVFSKPGVMVGGFNIILRCNTLGLPPNCSVAQNVAAGDCLKYPISASVRHFSDPVRREIGDETFYYGIFETTPPMPTNIEAEGEVLVGATRTISVPYGETRRFRVIANDPDTNGPRDEWPTPDPVPVGWKPPIDWSGICSCAVRLRANNSLTYLQDTAVDSALEALLGRVSGDCVTVVSPTPGGFVQDENPLRVEAFVRDVANNTIGYILPTLFGVNVTPKLTKNLIIYPTDAATTMNSEIGKGSPFFRDGKMKVTLSGAEFMTGTGDSFVSVNPSGAEKCALYVWRSNQDRLAMPSGFLDASALPSGNAVSCAGVLNLPSGLADGEYLMAIGVRDSDGDEALSNSQVFYVCNNRLSTGPDGPNDPCRWADFDRDGAAEGLFTDKYSSGDYKPCDNCVNLRNSDQEDPDANGIGEACEPNSCVDESGVRLMTGRCFEYRETVCASDTYDAANPETAACNPDGGQPDSCCPSVRTVDADGNVISLNPQECRCPWGLCMVGGQVCFQYDPNDGDDPPADPTDSNYIRDDECGFCTGNGSIGCLYGSTTCEDAGAGECNAGRGVCEDADGDSTGRLCKRNEDCHEGELCRGSNICDDLMLPWLETKQGNVYARSGIIMPEDAPSGKFNATYCITSSGGIEKFESQYCESQKGPLYQFARPSKDNAYRSSLGNVDLRGLLLQNKFGSSLYQNTVYNVASFNNLLDSAQSPLKRPLGNQIFVVVNNNEPNFNEPNENVMVDATTIPNAASGGKGNGTVVIIGADLNIRGNVTYATSQVERLDQLASLGWIVLPCLEDMGPLYTVPCTATRWPGAADPNNPGIGNVRIDGTVRRIAGSFFIGGKEGMYTAHFFNDPSTDPDESTFISENPLTVNGLVVARKFRLNRALRNITTPAESFVYDGRAVVNPPPGFADVTRVLPDMLDYPYTTGE